MNNDSRSWRSVHAHRPRNAIYVMYIPFTIVAVQIVFTLMMQQFPLVLRLAVAFEQESRRVDGGLVVARDLGVSRVFDASW